MNRNDYERERRGAMRLTIFLAIFCGVAFFWGVFALLEKALELVVKPTAASAAELNECRPTGPNEWNCSDPESQKKWEAWEASQRALVTVTAYTSHPEQTDDTPCEAADGSNICIRHAWGETICASNDYPFGTRLFLGGRIMAICTVADRMNRRYTGKGRVDLYMGIDLEEAWTFGVQENVPLTLID